MRSVNYSYIKNVKFNTVELGIKLRRFGSAAFISSKM